MRVLAVAPQPFYQDRGTPIGLRNVLEAAGELGHRIDLVTFPGGEVVAVPGVTIRRCADPFGFRDVSVGFSLRKLLLDVSLSATMRSLLRAASYDVLYAVEEAAFPAAVLARRYRVPLLYDMQSSLPEQLQDHRLFRGRRRLKMLRACERWLIGRADVIGCSAGLAARVRRVSAGASVEEWHYPAQAVDCDARQVAELRCGLGIDAASRMVLYAGNLAPYQGVERLLQAASLVVEQAEWVVFVLVGASGEERLLRSNRVAQLRDRGELKIVERQPRDRMPAYLAMADILVSPREGVGNLPLKIFDYLAAGKPIVATDTPSHRSVLDDSRALLVGLSAEEMARAIAFLLTRPERARELGDAARAYAAENLEWGAFRDRVGELLEAARRAGDSGAAPGGSDEAEERAAEREVGG